MMYLQNTLGEFVKPFIRNSNDTYRWIIDMRHYRDAHPRHPEYMIVDKIIITI
eukprot:UN11824